MKNKDDLGRRGLIGAGLVGLGGVAGWLARKFQGPAQVRKPVPTALDSRFVYDISEFETTKPELLLYDPGEHLPTGFERAKRLESLPGGRYLVAGDRGVKFFSKDGKLESEFALPAAPHCLLAAGDDELIVGFAKEFAVYDFSGAEKTRSPKLPGKAYLTSIAATDETLYLGDGGNREVLVCDRRTGEVVDQFGKKDEAKNNPGFAVPSPYFDLSVADDGKLRVVNPGRLRVETYSLDGRYESSWGGPGLRIDRFCGCCNPVYFDMMPDGSFITSEKGLARVNIYGPDGQFKGAVAGPETLVDDKELAKRACSDCSVGAGFDVALQDDGRVLVLDPFRMVVRPFTPKETAATT
ncbi:MAG: hypothetical protein KDM91_04205 [Verrucomicrobiae bacterium]|nr:hypothetical protein [Verrucomicrobiae bacterium]